LSAEETVNSYILTDAEVRQRTKTVNSYILTDAEVRQRTKTVNSYILTDAEVRQRTKTKNIVEVAYSVKWKWGAHVAGMGQRRLAHVTSMWNVSNRQKKNGATEDLTGRHVQECSRTMVTKRQKLERMVYTHTTSVNLISLGIAQIMIKIYQLSPVPPGGSCPHGVNYLLTCSMELSPS
jgi:hypothetical protein